MDATRPVDQLHYNALEVHFTVQATDQKSPSICEIGF